MIHQVLWHPNGEFKICCDIFFAYANLYCVVLRARSFIDSFQSGLIIGNPFGACFSLCYRFCCNIVVSRPLLLLQSLLAEGLQDLERLLLVRLCSPTMGLGA